MEIGNCSCGNLSCKYCNPNLSLPVNTFHDRYQKGFNMGKNIATIEFMKELNADKAVNWLNDNALMYRGNNASDCLLKAYIDGATEATEEVKFEVIQPLIDALEKLIDASIPVKDWLENNHSELEFEQNGHLATIHAELCSAIYDARRSK